MSGTLAASRVADWAALPLGEGGRSLIEASAGTGKTWTISVLYLRLLLESGLDPTRVVVTTFTDPAAAELRERLRGRLLWAQAAATRAADGELPASPDTLPPDEAWLHARWTNGGDTARRDLRQLRLALADLDLAPITTLHGLCRRILGDYPFECGSTFGLGELVAGDALDSELLDDLWRHLAQSPREALDAGERAWYARGRDELAQALRIVTRAGVGVRVVESSDPAQIMDAQWAARLREWCAGLRFGKRKSALKNAIHGLAEFIEASDVNGTLPKSVQDNLGKAPADQLLDEDENLGFAGSEEFAFCRRALDLITDPALAARTQALARFREELLARRHRALLERGQLSFDALIDRVHAALHGEHGRALADRLFEAWPVTLVDEFQDTDQLQYGILDAIYRSAAIDGEPRGRLVMIGDPKQAIYGFRGGDIDAYLRAKASADTQLHLDTNYRSASRFVGALNALYAHVGEALSRQPDAPISYEAVKPSPTADRAVLAVDGQSCAQPLVFHYFPEPPANKDQRREAALAACANQIARTLNDTSLRIAGQPVSPGDLAVLVPWNSDITQLRRLLAQRGVPCVGAGKSSVFGTDIARELQLLLAGIHHAGHEGMVRAALATRLYGLDFNALRALDEHLDAWQQHAARLHGWRCQWQREGVLAAVQSVVAHAAGGLLTREAEAEGERILTDLRHLGELLQAQSGQLSGPEELLAWMDRQRRGGGDTGGDAADDLQLRIESDARRVRLMTLHASKGLEFPIVFLPLMWAHEGRDEKLPVVHDDDGIGRVLDLGGPRHVQARERAEWANQDERFRVLYVALTRAKFACHVYGLPPDRVRDGRGKGKTSDATQEGGNERSPQDPKRSALDAMLAVAKENGGLEALAELPGIAWTEAPWPGEPARFADAHPPQTPRLASRRMPPLPPTEQRYSFSALTRFHPASSSEDSSAADEAGGDHTPRLDTVPPAPPEPHPEIQRLEPVKGTRIGNAIHQIFEDREVGRPVAEQPALVRQALKQHDVHEARLPPERLEPLLAQRIDAALAAELLPGLVLGALPAHALRAEMGFHFPLDAVSLDALRRAAREHDEPDLVPPGTTDTLRGLMTGKIDLTLEHAGRFHVLDYKGNWLGPAVADYQGEALTRAMDAHHYRFQALIYTVAVHRYLRQRVPGYDPARHLGEGIYLFVRAAGLAPGAGVWAHRFPDALIDAVDVALAGQREEAA
ncbi:UvrD-helicase domain-containing protein [Alkalisalibacterium limincola]|uniref:RecBCD enzyme subunit RecB n=1 Tax=Alkalisalibacterium limincola TaxID=2699169 RepID=A0A5C8KMH8_9GAMM|nr:UvrD-helicase domain-containing protein [Alkalisalibacterium limincola]TXK60961.1 AAA family ATPase [Alkalisalibacterium limincola]